MACPLCGATPRIGAVSYERGTSQGGVSYERGTPAEALFLMREVPLQGAFELLDDLISALDEVVKACGMPAELSDIKVYEP